MVILDVLLEVPVSISSHHHPCVDSRVNCKEEATIYSIPRMPTGKNKHVIDISRMDLVFSVVMPSFTHLSLVLYTYSLINFRDQSALCETVYPHIHL